MVKLADTPALGAGAARHEGSTPSPPTKYKTLDIQSFIFLGKNNFFACGRMIT